jgi:DNA-binding response OmpR family regulator
VEELKERGRRLWTRTSDIAFDVHVRREPRSALQAIWDARQSDPPLEQEATLHDERRLSVQELVARPLNDELRDYDRHQPIDSIWSEPTQILKGESIHLTPTEYRLLEAMATNPGKLMTHRLLLQKVWGPGYGTESNYLRLYVRQLRQKLGDDPARPKWITTEPGLGYRWLQEPARE